MKKIILPVVCVFFFGVSHAQSLSIVNVYRIKSDGWWDYITVHDKRLYVSHGTQVNILDEFTGDSLGVILETTGVHGIAFDDELHKGFTSNGRLNNVTVFDPVTDKTTGHIVTGQNPDAIMF